MDDDDEDTFTVSPEAIGFLTAIGLSVVLLLFLFYYINRKMWPGRDGGFHCAKNHKDPDLHGSSSESEDEAVGKYHEAVTRQHGTRPGPDKQPSYMWETRQKYSPLSAEYDGYSSEVSADEGKERTKGTGENAEEGDIDNTQAAGDEHMTAGTGENTDEGDMGNAHDTDETEPQEVEEDNADKSASLGTDHENNNKTTAGKKEKSGKLKRKEKKTTKSLKKDKPKKKERFCVGLKTKNPLMPK